MAAEEMGPRTERNAERRRLAEADESGVRWRRWGPYLSERQWGTGDSYERDGDELTDEGLYVALDGWRWHLAALDAPTR